MSTPGFVGRGRSSQIEYVLPPPTWKSHKRKRRRGRLGVGTFMEALGNVVPRAWKGRQQVASGQNFIIDRKDSEGGKYLLSNMRSYPSLLKIAVKSSRGGRAEKRLEGYVISTIFQDLEKTRG